MTGETAMSGPEKRETLDDNARKFILEPLDARFLDDTQATTFTLVVDWLTTNESDETKVAHKVFADDKDQTLLIAKHTVDGNRTTTRRPLTDNEYAEMRRKSIAHLEKVRYEFLYVQGEMTFAMKYDVFTDRDLRILEVDAGNEQERAAFAPEQFPVALREVTGDMHYYGYRVCQIV